MDQLAIEEIARNLDCQHQAGEIVPVQIENTKEHAAILLAGFSTSCKLALLSPKNTAYEQEARLRAIKNNPDELAKPGVVFFTSGSCGEPKPVTISKQAFEAMALASNTITRFGKGDVWLCAPPLFHVGGAAILFRAAVSGGAVKFCTRGSADIVLAALQQDPGINFVSLVPTVLEKLIHIGARELQRMKCILLGGAAVSQKLRQSVSALKLPVLIGYGMTETASHVTLGPLSTNGASGKALPGVELSIEQDEIIVSTPELKYFHTRDLGSLSASGELTIFGRKDRIIISGGENISPEEIEMAARDCPGVVDCVVTSTADQEWGERPALWVEGKLELAELRAHLASRLARYKIPKQTTIVDELPRTELGKIDIRRLA